MDKTLIHSDFNENFSSVDDEQTELLDCIKTLRCIIGNLTEYDTGISADMYDKLVALNNTAWACRVKIEMEKWEHINHPPHEYVVKLKRIVGDIQNFAIDDTLQEWVVSGTLYNLGCLIVEVLREHVSYSIYSDTLAKDNAVMTMDRAYPSLGKETQHYVRVNLPKHYLLIDIKPST